MLWKRGRRWMIVFVIAVTLPAVVSCALGPTTAPVAAHSECAGWSPIRLSAHDVDVLSDAAVTQVLSHNRYGAARCGWKP